MTFDDILEQVIAPLKRQGRVSYGALRRRYDLDEAYLEDLKDEIIHAQCLAVDEDNRLLVWAENTGVTAEPTSQPDEELKLEPQPIVKQAEPAHIQMPSIESHVRDMAERRQLTVMFCDLVGSTELSGKFDAEEYREVVRAYQAICSEVIQHFDCHIAQTLGDGLLIYSGYPVAHENDAERAVRTGLGIMTAMGELNSSLEKDKGIRLAVRVGIHTGPVVVGEVGAGSRPEQLALGEVPNIAARIQGLAEPNTVVISEATYRLIQGYFDFETIGERELRGIVHPVVVYQVLRESRIQSRLDIASTRGLTPLVGRNSELQLLIDRWHQVKSGEGQVVLLNAEPGLGKSRMVQALREHLVDEAYTRLECRSSPYYQNTALYPVIDLIQRTLGWQQGDAEDEKLNKLEQALSQYHLPVEETIPLMADLLPISVPEDQYLPLNLTPQRQRQKILETIVAMLVELAERQPVLFILEDLHWTDPSTLELLDHLVDQTPTASLYLLLTCRPEFQSQWSNRSYFSQVTLSRLSHDDIEQMVSKVTGGKPLPGEIIHQLVEKTDGVPLYVEEMTKSVLESGVLKEMNGHYELSGPIGALSIPSTLQDSLMSRLDRLVTAKGVAQYASVIGRQFTYELLQSVSQLDEVTLQRELGRLVEAELVYQRGVLSAATYIFKHALIQDTAYESLLRSTRQGYHRRVAEVLAERFPETVEIQPELLAHYYTGAGLAEQAVGYWHQAGQTALGRSATVKAVKHFETGLELLQALPETHENLQHELTLQLSLALAYHASKGQSAPELERAYMRAQELCEDIGDDHQLFHVLMGLYRCYGGQHEKSREYVKELVRVAQRVQDPHLLLESFMAQGVLILHDGEFKGACEQLEKCLALYRPHNHRVYVTHSSIDPGVTSLSRLSWTLWFLGYPQQALTRSQETLTLARKLGHANSLGMACNFAALLHQWCRDGQAVYEQVQSATAFATEYALYVRQVRANIMAGWYLVHRGQGEAGIAQMQQGLTDYSATGTTLYREWYLALLAEAYGDDGQISIALDTLAEAMAVARDVSVSCWEPEFYRLKGELLLQQSPATPSEAESCFHQAITIAQNQSAKSWELRAATSLARLWQSQGKRTEAHELLEPVYSWFTEGFDTLELIEAKALLDELA